MTWGDRPDKEEYDRAQAAENRRATNMLNNLGLRQSASMFSSAEIAVMGMGFAHSVISQAALGIGNSALTPTQRRERAAQDYAAKVRARSPSMQVKRLVEPMP